MEPATTRFFAIPELVIQVTQCLDYKDIAKFMRTSRRMHALCIPAHYYNILTTFELYRSNNALHSPVSAQALAKNVHHVRQLHLRRNDVVYYVNCLMLFQDLLATPTVGMTPPAQKQEQEQLQHRQQPFSQQRPRWLAPPDPHICFVLPIPPMTLLTTLAVSLEHQWSLGCSANFLQSYKDPKAMLTQVCWIMDLNPHLLDLSLSSIYLKDQRDICIFATSLFGLKKLQRCTLDFNRWTQLSVPGRLGSAVFFSCPPSLRTLRLLSSNEDYEDYSRHPRLSEDYMHLPSGTPQPWEKSDEECGLTALPRRQEPLPQLTKLYLGYLGVDDILEEDFLTMLEHCPNLLELPMPTLPHVRKNEQLAQDIARCCPKLRVLTNEAYDRTLATQELTLRTFRALPPQQLRTFHYIGDDNLVIQGLDDVGGLFRRHSSTLQNIVLTGCESFRSKAIQVILVECQALEVLRVEWTSWGNNLTITLEDAIEFPWASTRIRELKLATAIPDEPFHHLADGVVPFYHRPPPTTLSVAETEQFALLEGFYQHIGALTELRRLELQAVFFDPQVNHLTPTDGKFVSFPGMLNLECQRTGRPGYLHHLGGLKKLEMLLGSVRATTPETKATMGMNEAAWMGHHWPALNTAAFFKKTEDEISEPFLWLQQQRERSDGPKLDLWTW